MTPSASSLRPGPAARRTAAAPVRSALSVLALSVLALSVPAAAAQGADDEGGWLRLPRPDLSSLEPAVAEQLDSLRGLAAELASDSDVPPGELAESVGELARHYHAYVLRDAAESAYRIARRLAPDDFRWVYLEGHLLHQAGRLEEAEPLYRRALELAPQAIPGWVRLGRIYAELGRAAEAGAAFEEALKRDPHSPAALAGLGELRLADDRFAEAAELFERALELAPEASRLRYPLALAYRGLGDEDRARAELALRGTVGVRPADPVVDALDGLRTGERVYLLRGRAALRAGDVEAAAEAFRRARDANPDSVPARVNLAAVLSRLGDADAAMGELLAAVDIAPANVPALFNLGALHFERGELEAAAERLRQAASYDPDDAEVRRWLGDALRRLGRPDEALPHYRAAVAQAPGSEAARMGEAASLVDLERYREARARLEEGHVLLPASGRIAAALARILAQCPDPALRDGGRAVELAEKVYRARPTLTHAVLVGASLAEAGRCEEAAEWQRALIAKVEQEGVEGDLLPLRLPLERYESGPPCRLPSPAE